MSYRIGPNVVNGHTFTCSDRYMFQDSKILGRGSFGVVTTAVDSESSKIIAIKRIRPYANDDWDARHTLREIRLMRFLGPHPNVISLYNLSLFDEKSELYMMMELMDCDLHRVIQSKQTLTPKHYKCFLKQILEAVKAMHEVGIFHRDLKPGNILVSKDCQIRVTDFGLARFIDEKTRLGHNKVNPMTEYVVTRWYRAPELLLAPTCPYDEAIDLWSVGCIMAELYRRKPLFPGKSHAHQVQMIFEVMGYNPNEDMGFCVNGEASQFLEKRCVYRKQPLSNVVPGLTNDALDLLEDLLNVNPAKRPTAAASLRVTYLDDADVICDYTKKYATRPTVKDFEFEQAKFTLEELRQMINEEVRLYENLGFGRPPVRFHSPQGSYSGQFDSFSNTNSRKGSVNPFNGDKGDESVRSSWDGYGRNESRDDETPVSQMQTQRPNGTLANQANGPYGQRSGYIPPEKLLDKLSALRVSGGSVSSGAGLPNGNNGIAATNVPDTEDTSHETASKIVQDSTAIDIKPRRSSLIGGASSMVSSSRNSPHRTPSPSQVTNNTSNHTNHLNKANPKFRQRLLSTASITGGSIPTSGSQGPTTSDTLSSVSRSYAGKSSLAAAGAAMVNGGTSSSLEFPPRNGDSTRVTNSQYTSNQTSQRKSSLEFNSIFSQLHGRYQSFHTSKIVSGDSSDGEENNSDALDGLSERKITSAPDRRQSITQTDSDSMQSRLKSFAGITNSVSRR